MNKSELIEALAQDIGIPHREAAAITNTVIDTMTEALARGESIEIRGFGTFKVVERAPRTGRNPRTGSEVKISSRRSPIFKPSKELRSRVDNTSGDKGDKKNALWSEEKAA